MQRRSQWPPPHSLTGRLSLPHSSCRSGGRRALRRSAGSSRSHRQRQALKRSRSCTVIHSMSACPCGCGRNFRWAGGAAISNPLATAYTTLGLERPSVPVSADRALHLDRFALTGVLTNRVARHAFEVVAPQPERVRTSSLAGRKLISARRTTANWMEHRTGGAVTTRARRRARYVTPSHRRTTYIRRHNHPGERRPVCPTCFLEPPRTGQCLSCGG